MTQPTSETGYGRLLRDAYLEIKRLRTELEILEEQRKAPIAIVGLGCRFPGHSNDPGAFWRLLRDGKHAMIEVPRDRWDVGAYYDPDPEVPGKMYTLLGGFLEEVYGFDNEFFGISPREANSLDPHHRLLLEVAWEALENAGQVADELFGSLTGVFVGISNLGYDKLLIEDARTIDSYSTSGIAMATAAGRLSYVLGVNGPCVALDTACSSSLVATHLACQSLRLKECDLALAGGVNLILSPDVSISFCKSRMLARDGLCKAFDASADGFARGEGCGIIVLKRLADAEADGDNILAVIRGSAVNQDGASGGLTVPSGPAQQAVIRSALENASLEPAQIDYVEAHGSGTSLGDPIEMGAIGSVFGSSRERDRPLVVGSVKTNVGHLETAAGAAGLIKTVLAMQHQLIPPHLHFQEPSPHIPWDSLPITVPREPVPWPRGDRPRRAGISSFGVSGTNAHIVLEEVPVQDWEGPEVERPVHLLTLSAKTEPALADLVNRYSAHIDANSEQEWGDICYSADACRSHFSHRLSLVAETSTEAKDKLAALEAGSQPAGTSRGVAGEQPKIAFLFSGHGGQYIGMGRELYESSPAFRQALDRCQEVLASHLDLSLHAILYPEPGTPSVLDQMAYAQPALFALEYALAQLWMSWGIGPAVTMGHSVGEYAAACVAGVFSLEAGLLLTAARGQLLQSLPEKGEMVAVFAGEELVAPVVEAYGSSVAIAAVNGPQNVVISGMREALAELVARLNEAGIRTRKLSISAASHSPLVEPILGDLQRVARKVSFSAPRVKLVSNVIGEVVGEEITSPEYWLQHLRQPVRFAEGMLALRDCDAFLEIGPQPVLLGMGLRCYPTSSALWLPSLRQGEPEWKRMLHSLGMLYSRGAYVDWRGVYGDRKRRQVTLPMYPFQRQRYRPAPPGSARETAGFTQGVVGSRKLHPLLGQRLYLAGVEKTHFGTQIGLREFPFLSDHQAFRETVLPAAVFLEMALAAGSNLLEEGAVALEQIVFERALLLPEETSKTLQMVLDPRENRAYSLQIMSPTTNGPEEEPSWLLHVSGKLRALSDERTEINFAALTERFTEEVDAGSYYSELAARGIHYGTRFRGIRQLWRGDGEALAHIVLPPGLETRDYRLHPVLLDACLQTSGIAHREVAEGEIYLPISIERLRAWDRTGSSLWCHAKARTPEGKAGQARTVDLNLLTAEGQLVARIDGLHVVPASREALLGSLQPSWERWLYRTEWRPQAVQSESELASSPESWLIFADSQGVGEELKTLLRGRGNRCALIHPGPKFEELQDLEFTIRPGQPPDLHRLVSRVAGTNQPPLRGIVHLWALDAMHGAALTTDGLEAASRLGCESTLHIVQALSSLELATPPAVWLVTRGSVPVRDGDDAPGIAQSALWGMGKVVSLEHPELKCVRVDLDPVPVSDPARDLLGEILATGSEDQVAFRNELRFVARLARGRLVEPVEARSDQVPRPFKLTMAEPGTLDNLVLRPMTRRPPETGEIEVRVRAMGLNFLDVLMALGLVPMEQDIGSECVGEIVSVGEAVEDFQVGQEVLCIASGCFSEYITISAALAAQKPKGLSEVEAATVSVNFLTASYGLDELAKVSAGDRVLIHSAAGGTGMAAVQLAIRAGASVYGSASPWKWEHLRSMGVEQTFDSRSLEFADQVMEITGGQGVDIVFNSLAGEFITKSFSVLGANGRFIEIGKRDIWNPDKVAQIRPDVGYFPVDLSRVCQENPAYVRSLLGGLAQEFEAGVLRPLPRKVFPVQESISAFRYMQQAKHIGKIVISPPDGTGGAGSTGEVSFRSDGTYLITGGLGGLGLRTASWMVERGARHLVLLGRSGAGPSAEKQLEELRQAGAEVVVALADVSQRGQVAAVLEQVEESLPQLRGILHMAGVLDDGVLLQQSWERFATVMAPKVSGAWNLHLLTKDRPLDFFVLYSSVASLLGSPGQANHVAANTFLDALAHHRQAQRLPGLSINWGGWAGVGTVARHKLERRPDMRGAELINPDQGLELLGRLLTQPQAQIGIVPIQWSLFPSSWARSPFFDDFLLPRAVQEQMGFRQELDAMPAGERHQLLLSHVRDQVARVLGYNPEGLVDLNKGFFELGMDSLTSIELRNLLQTSLDCSLPATASFDHPTINALAEYLAQEVLGWEPAHVAVADHGEIEQTQAALVEQIERIPEEEMAASIEQELSELEDLLHND